MVDTATPTVQQPEFEGLPDRKPGIWPDVTMFETQHRVYQVNLAFGGTIELKVGDVEASWIAEKLTLGGALILEVEVTADRIGHRLVEGKPIGLARAHIWDAAPAGELGLLKLQSENRRVRERVDEADAAVTNLARVFADFIIGHNLRVPSDLDEAMFRVKAAVSAAVGHE